MFCSKCGEKLSEGTNFCQKCGNNITDNITSINETGMDTKKLSESNFIKNQKLEKKLWIIGSIGVFSFPIPIIGILSPVGVIIIIIAFIVRHRNGKDVMLPGGIISTVIGFFMTISGYIMPSRGKRISTVYGYDYENYTSIKNGFVFVGIVLLVLGIILLVLRYMKKNKVD